MILTFILLALTASFIDCGRLQRSTVDKELFDAAQSALSRLTPENASEQLKEMVAAKDDNTHWCCRIDPPVGIGDQTYVANYNQIMSQSQRCGYSSCGFLGWSSCTRWCMVYWSETKYYTEHYNYYYLNQCPADHLICCVDYLNILGHCLHIDEITSNLPLLQQLQQEGVVIPGLSGRK